MSELRHVAKLPYGYEATFVFAAPHGMRVEWEPGVPDISHPRRWRKFFAEYRRARADFLAMLATVLDVPVLALDVSDGPATVAGFTVIEPETRQ